MKFLVHAILLTTFLGASALQASSPAVGGPNQNAIHRSKEHRTSAVVLDSSGEAALEGSVHDLPLSLLEFSASSELATTAESQVAFSTKQVLETHGKAAVSHKPAGSVRTPLTLAQLLTTGGKSALSRLEQLRSLSGNAIGGVDSLGILLPIIFCCFPAALILAACTVPSWFRASTEPAAPAGAALLDKPAVASRGIPGSRRPQPQGDPSDIAWRSRVSQDNVVAAPEPVIETEEEGRGDLFSTSSMMKGFSSLFGDFGAPAQTRFAAKQAPQVPLESDVLCPEMVVREGTGAQFMLDGLFCAYEQNTFADVRRNNSDMNETEVMKTILCEGAPDGGILLEWPVGRTPIAFLNTSNAVSPKGAPKPSNRYITIIPCFNQPFQKTTPPFAIIQADRTGFAVKRYSGDKVLLRVLSGGHNTDYANVVDPNGRLMATMTLRGQSVKNRRVITMCQGMDAVLVISAVIAATKLS